MRLYLLSKSGAHDITLSCNLTTAHEGVFFSDFLVDRLASVVVYMAVEEGEYRQGGKLFMANHS